MRPLALLLAFSTTTAFALDISRGPDRRIQLRASCDEVNDEVKALRSWTTSSGRSCSTKSLSSENGVCVTDIHDCVPEHVQKYQDAVPETSGPNCWNLALVMKGMLPALRLTSHAEATFLVGSGLCRQVTTPQPGDLAMIRRPDKKCGVAYEENCEMHGFIYVSEKLGYSKNGGSRKAPYRLQPNEVFYKEYGVGRGSRIDYFRCQSREDFLASLTPANDWQRALDELDFVDCVVSETAARPHVFTEAEQKQLVDAIGAVYEFVKKEADGQKDKDEKFLYDAIALRLESIEAQMEGFRTNDVGTGVSPIRRGFPLRSIYEKSGREISPEYEESLRNLDAPATAPRE